MRGTEMMSESFAQYAALMVMEREYGRDKMNKFLKYEMNGYLRGRSGEFEAETTFDGNREPRLHPLSKRFSHLVLPQRNDR
jgi:hypothetical protein